ncbi:MAG: hypothetical protein ABJ079_08140, partial [Marinomonas sp.]
RVESLADAEAQLDVEADQRAAEVADKLARVEALYEEALSTKIDAEADARLILDRAEAESAATRQQALAKLDEKSRKLDRQSSDLQSARTAFEYEKRTIVRETVSRVASVTARVLLGVLVGNVRFGEKRSELQFNDPKLAQDVEQFEIAPIIQKAVVLVSKVWTKLTGVLSASDAEIQRKHVSEALEPIAQPKSRGIQP